MKARGLRSLRTLYALFLAAAIWFQSSRTSWLFVRAKFDPYADNGGTLLGIAGKDYCLLASDTRLSDGYIIRSRETSRLYEITDGLLFGGCGCLSDTLELRRSLSQAADSFQWAEDRPLNLLNLASLLSHTLYQRRFFPYYSFCAVAGLDEEGRGGLYKYDAVGSFERVRAVCAGKGEHMLQPFIDDITEMDRDEALWDPILVQKPRSPRPTAGTPPAAAADDDVSATTAAIAAASDGGGGASAADHHSSRNTTVLRENIGVDISSGRGDAERDSASVHHHQHAHPLSTPIQQGWSGIEGQSGDQLTFESSNAGARYLADLSAEEACALAVRAFRAAAERDITVGDGVHLWLLRRSPSAAIAASTTATVCGSGSSGSVVAADAGGGGTLTGGSARGDRDDSDGLVDVERRSSLSHAAVSSTSASSPRAHTAFERDAEAKQENLGSNEGFLPDGKLLSSESASSLSATGTTASPLSESIDGVLGGREGADLTTGVAAPGAAFSGVRQRRTESGSMDTGLPRRFRIEKRFYRLPQH